MDLVEKALNLNGTIVMGLPISVQYTEAERNRTHAGDGCVTDLTDLVLPCCWLINKSQEFESSTWRVPPRRNAVRSPPSLFGILLTRGPGFTWAPYISI